MFLIFDESEEGREKVLGGVLMPESMLPSFEAACVSLRIKHKLFGEMKWTKVKRDQYHKRYCDFIDLFFQEKRMTFHSIFYGEGEKYLQGYVLIRNITLQMERAGLNEPLYVLFDKTSNGQPEVEKIRRKAERDLSFRQELIFCGQCDSHMFASLQIADLIAGAISATVNNKKMSEQKTFLREYIEEKEGKALDWSTDDIPVLGEYKIELFDPRVGGV